MPPRVIGENGEVTQANAWGSEARRRAILTLLTVCTRIDPYSNTRLAMN